jgi:hypothetical protein
MTGDCAYCAVAGGLSNLPHDCLRSVLIDAAAGRRQEVRPFPASLPADEAKPIKEALAEWCAEHEAEFYGADPQMPQGIDDRDADCWEPLLAVADVAGAEWPRRAREAAVALVARSAERTQTSGVQLLSDLFEVFKGAGADKLATETVLHRLQELPGRPGRTYGKPLISEDLRLGLSDLGLSPRS